MEVSLQNNWVHSSWYCLAVHLAIYGNGNINIFVIFWKKVISGFSKLRCVNYTEYGKLTGCVTITSDVSGLLEHWCHSIWLNEYQIWHFLWKSWNLQLFNMGEDVIAWFSRAIFNKLNVSKKEIINFFFWKYHSPFERNKSLPSTFMNHLGNESKILCCPLTPISMDFLFRVLKGKYFFYMSSFTLTGDIKI